jgi:GAF domain-containing protein
LEDYWAALHAQSSASSKTSFKFHNHRAVAMEEDDASAAPPCGFLGLAAAALQKRAPAARESNVTMTCGASESAAHEGRSAMQAVAAASASSSAHMESARLKALLRYSITNSTHEPQFDSITSAASEICETPAALVAFVDDKTTWFKSNFGFGSTDKIDRGLSVCDHLVKSNSNDLFIISDLRSDSRTKDNPLVTGAPYLRFYAGAPLMDSHTGLALGALCVVDYVPRTLTEIQISSMKLLSKQVMAAAESRVRILDLQTAMRQLEQTQAALAQAKEQAEQALALAEQASKAKSSFLAKSVQSQFISVARACSSQSAHEGISDVFLSVFL